MECNAIYNWDSNSAQILIIRLEYELDGADLPECFKCDVAKYNTARNCHQSRILAAKKPVKFGSVRLSPT